MVVGDERRHVQFPDGGKKPHNGFLTARTEGSDHRLQDTVQRRTRGAAADVRSRSLTSFAGHDKTGSLADQAGNSKRANAADGNSQFNVDAALPRRIQIFSARQQDFATRPRVPWSQLAKAPVTSSLCVHSKGSP